MARYVTTVRTPRSPEDAFAYVADLCNFAEWDPGVVAAEQVEGRGIGLGAVYDVTVKNPGRDITLRYRTVEIDVPRTIRVVAKSWMFTSDDRITVEPDGAGSLVTYDAELRLNGLLRFGDLGLRIAFGRIGDRAAAGLRTALDGEAASR
jgi:carbon monoxide dehydrogenase subunit G